MKKDPVWLVICNGGAQMATALAVLARVEASNQYPPRPVHLLLCESSLPPEQEPEFLETMRELAMACRSWAGFHQLTDKELRSLSDTARAGELSRKRARDIHRRLGLPDAELVITKRDISTSLEPLLDLFPQARRLVYGDGLGLWVPLDQLRGWAPPASPAEEGRPKSGSGQLGNLCRRLYSRVRRALGQRTELYDQAYYLIGTGRGGGEPIRGASTRLRPAEVLAVFQKWIPLGESAGFTETLRDLAGTPCDVMLTTNFSEAGRMTAADEIKAYHEYLRPMVRAPLLIIKPHPRDTRAKIQELSRTLREEGMYEEVVDLGQLAAGRSFFWPFEILAAALHGVCPVRQFHCFSTACVGVHIILGVDCGVGLGTDLVNKYFQPDQAELRIRHEAELRRIMDELKSQEHSG